MCEEEQTVYLLLLSVRSRKLEQYFAWRSYLTSKKKWIFTNKISEFSIKIQWTVTHRREFLNHGVKRINIFNNIWILFGRYLLSGTSLENGWMILGYRVKRLRTRYGLFETSLKRTYLQNKEIDVYSLLLNIIHDLICLPIWTGNSN